MKYILPKGGQITPGKPRRPTLGAVSIRGIEFLLSQIDMQDIRRIYDYKVVHSVESVMEYLEKHKAWREWNSKK